MLPARPAELAGVAETASPDIDWCWANQVADAFVTMQHLVDEAIAVGAETVDLDALDTQIHRYRSAAQIGISQTTARSDAVMKRHNAWPAG